MAYDIGTTLKKCRNAAKISVKEISDLLTEKGFKASESTIYSWENGNSQPTPGALLTMCIAYGVEDILSTFGYDGYNRDGSICLNMDEIEIIEKYRDLDSHGKKMVDFTLNEEWERSVLASKPSITLLPQPKRYSDVQRAKEYLKSFDQLSAFASIDNFSDESILEFANAIHDTRGE